MFSGGFPLSAADNTRIRNLQDGQDNQQEALAGLSQTQEDASQVLGDVNNEYSVARQDFESKRVGVEGAQKEFDRYNHDLDDQGRQLDISKTNWESAMSLAQFFKYHAEKELSEDQEQALLEACYENRNRSLEAFCTAIQSIMHFGVALAGGVSPKNATFDPSQILRVEQPEEDQSPQYFAQAQSQWKNFEKQKEYLEEKKNDPFYADKVAEAEGEFADAEAGYHELDARRTDARADYDAAKDSVYDAQRVLRGLGGQIRDIAAKADK